MEKNKKQNKKVQFVVVREFSGDKTMREAFEQVIERQTCEHFEEWLEHREMAQINARLLQAGEELRHVSQRLVRLEEQGQRELADELDVELGQSLHMLGTHLGMAMRSASSSGVGSRPISWSI